MRAPDPVLQALIFQKQGPVQGPSQLPIIVGENPGVFAFVVRVRTSRFRLREFSFNRE